jgi:hypothetical protein
MLNRTVSVIRAIGVRGFIGRVHAPLPRYVVATTLPYGDRNDAIKAALILARMVRA